MPNETPTFYLGLTMAGAVSAGCYTAGVMDYLFEILDLWERAKKGKVEGIPADLVPQYDVVIDAMGGASAGGMATIMTAIYALEGKINPVKEVPADPLASQNILYDSWVHLADDRAGGALSFEKIWNTDDLEGPDSKVHSLFNSKFIDKIADRAFTFQGARNLEEQVVQLPSYISKNLEVLLSHALLRGVPLEVHFKTEIGADRGDAPAHASFEHFLLSHFKLNDGKPVAENDGYLWLNPYQEQAVEKLKLSTISTGAFPVGLRYRNFGQQQFSSDYFKAVIERIVYGDFSGQNPDAHDELELQLPPNFESLTIDGGAINNEPYREVASIMSRHEDKNSPFQNYGLIMIDPFPDTYEEEEDEYDENKPEDLIDVIPAIITTLWDQSKIKRKEMIEQFSRDYVHSEIYPKRNYTNEAGELDTKDYPIASGSFAAFGGFLDINFRVHDFFLGRNNARNFVRYFFSLPYYEGQPEKNHPIHRNWSAASIEKYKIKKKGQIYLPIIPDLNIALKNLKWSGAEWNDYTVKEIPKYHPQPLFDLEDKIEARFERLFEVFVEKFSGLSGAPAPLTDKWLAIKNRKGWFGRVTGKIFGFAARRINAAVTGLFTRKIIGKMAGTLTEFTIQTILKDLEKKGLLEDPPN